MEEHVERKPPRQVEKNYPGWGKGASTGVRHDEADGKMGGFRVLVKEFRAWSGYASFYHFSDSGVSLGFWEDGQKGL